ncbi:hypothetical protein [Calothrix sp. PCC 6303]|nr:hypothetical protein [Calothrix sp. PCC 6303]
MKTKSKHLITSLRNAKIINFTWVQNADVLRVGQEANNLINGNQENIP